MSRDEELSEGDWQRILLLLAASLELDNSPPGPLRLRDWEILATKEETRLKFNSPVVVTSLSLRVKLDAGKSQVCRGEIELLYWHLDDEWELCAAEWF